MTKLLCLRGRWCINPFWATLVPRDSLPEEPCEAGTRGGVKEKAF